MTDPAVAKECATDGQSKEPAAGTTAGSDTSAVSMVEQLLVDVSARLPQAKSKVSKTRIVESAKSKRSNWELHVEVILQRAKDRIVGSMAWDSDAIECHENPAQHLLRLSRVAQASNQRSSLLACMSFVNQHRAPTQLAHNPLWTHAIVLVCAPYLALLHTADSILILELRLSALTV